MPFPNERRLLKAYFMATADVGGKLHLHDPRHGLDDQYFELRESGLTEITREAFFRAEGDGPRGVAIDCKRSIFHLRQAGARLLAREEKGAVYALEIKPEVFAPGLLVHLEGLPNLEQIQLSGTGIGDNDLTWLAALPRLEGVGLNHTDVTWEGIRILEKISAAELIQADHLEPAGN